MRRWGLVVGVILLAGAASIGAWRVAVFTASVASELDRASALTDIAPRPQSTIVFDRHGKPAFSFFVEQRTSVPLERVSPQMVQAILAVEDRRFFQHFGVDPVRIVGAAWRNIRAGRIVEGGSTITQQLARAAQLSAVRTYERKIREVVLAARLEERYSKARILEEYLNTVYFGEGYYGVEAAARGYFGKSAADLDLADAALLAALVRSPSADAPCVSRVRATRRRNLVLTLMRNQRRISPAELQSAAATTVPGESHKTIAASAQAGGGTHGLYFEEEVRRQLVQRFGADRVLRGGLRVYSTYDPQLQLEAERAVTRRIAQIAGARKDARDLQGSLIAMSPSSGDVYAIVGGRDFRESSFNRATQARRQAGSAFKPIIYAAALERGFSPGTLLKQLDTPIEGSEAWLPGGDHERDEYTLRRALKVSSNRAAAQLLQQVGVTTAIYYAQRLGIESRLPMVPSLALGTGEVTLLELTAAYTAFANRGSVASPRLLVRVEDQSGETIWFGEERHVQAISPTTAYLMSSMLSDVVTSGTATRVRTAGFKLPAAGKTGTTDDYADAWFIGYTPHLLTGVWFGLDQPAPIMRGGFGGTVAAPAWARFMTAATRGAKPDWYQMPADVQKVRICRLSGMRAGPRCDEDVIDAAPAPAAVDASYPAATVQDTEVPPPEPNVYEDLFPVGAMPSEICALHDAAPPTIEGSTTPIVDALVQPASHTTPALPTPGTAIRTPAVRLYVDRVPQSDGSVRTIVRER
jgi:penicillin-binding protein 1A